MVKIKRQVFYSFHFKNDVMRVQLVRNIGAIEDNKPVSANAWEEVKRKGEGSIKKWIDANMKGRSCVIVLIGSETADRKWIDYEIEQAWNNKKGLVGIYIHNLECPNNGKSTKGINPFNGYTVGKDKKALNKIVKSYIPSSNNAYKDIADNLDDWIEEAIDIRSKHP